MELAIVLALVAAIFFVYWLRMLIDCLTCTFKNETDRIVWLLVLILLNVLGAILYQMLSRRSKV